MGAGPAVGLTFLPTPMTRIPPWELEVRLERDGCSGPQPPGDSVDQKEEERPGPGAVAQCGAFQGPGNIPHGSSFSFLLRQSTVQPPWAAPSESSGHWFHEWHHDDDRMVVTWRAVPGHIGLLESNPGPIPSQARQHLGGGLASLWLWLPWSQIPAE